MTRELADEIERLVALTESSHIAEARQAAKDLGTIMSSLRRVEALEQEVQENSDLAFTVDPENGASILWREMFEAERAKSDAALRRVEKLEGALGESEAALKVCRQSLIEQAAARLDPTMPLISPDLLEYLRNDAEAQYVIPPHPTKRTGGMSFGELRQIVRALDARRAPKP